MSTTEQITRIVDGQEVPAPGTWTVDPGHTEVAFVGRHFMMTRVRGRFTGVEGAIVVAADPRHSTVEVTIDMASVESGSAARDEHLRSEDHFDVDRHPTATFRSTAVDWTGPTASVAGELTIVGVTRPVTLDVELLGAVADPWGGERAVFSARAEVNREDWGLTWNQALEAGGILVSKTIRIEIELEALRAAG
jgi:polyisoprenoid-binding protein YceI